MKNKAFILILGLLGSFGVACSQEKGKIEVRNPQPKVLDKMQAQVSALVSYELVGVDESSEACTTGKRFFTNKEEKCLSLQLDIQNSHCAEKERREYFAKHCSGEFSPEVLLPEPTPRYRSPELSNFGRGSVAKSQVLSCQFSFVRKDPLASIWDFRSKDLESEERAALTEGPTQLVEEAIEYPSVELSEYGIEQLMLGETLILGLPGKIYARVSLDRAPLEGMDQRVNARLGHQYLRQELIYVEKEESFSRSVIVSFSGILQDQIEKIEELTPVVYEDAKFGTYKLHCGLVEESSMSGHMLGSE